MEEFELRTRVRALELIVAVLLDVCVVPKESILRAIENAAQSADPTNVVPLNPDQEEMASGLRAALQSFVEAAREGYAIADQQ